MGVKLYFRSTFFGVLRTTFLGVLRSKYIVLLNTPVNKNYARFLKHGQHADHD